MANLPPLLTSPQWSSRTKRTIVLIVLGLLFFAAIQLRNAWYPVVIAILLAYLLMPVVDFFEGILTYVPTRELRRSLSVVLTYATLIGVIVMFGLLIVPPLSHQLQEFTENSPTLLKEVQTELSKPINIGSSTVEPWQAIQKAFAPENERVNGNVLGEGMSLLLAPAADILGGVFSILATILITFALLFYAMKDGPHFVEAIERLVPPSYRGDMYFFVNEMGKIWDAYFRGQLILGTTMGITTFIGATIVGLPQPLVLALLAAFLEFIPNIGPTLAATPAVLIALVTPSDTIPGLDGGMLFALIVAAMYMGFQMLEGLILVPRVMGYSLNLHPFVILVALLFGAKVAGVLGVILAAPVTATLRLILSYLWTKIFEVDALTMAMPKPMHPMPPALGPAVPPALKEPIAEGEIIE